MWRLAILCTALSGLSLTACAWATVTYVVDGDTIEVVITSEDTDNLLVEGATYRVRVIGIDTPEVHGQVECYGREASAFLKNLVQGKQVVLEKDVRNVDDFSRLLRYVWAELDPQRAGPELVNEEIVRAGYATVATYPPDIKYVDLLRQAEQYARENGLGLWSACPPGAPPPAPPPPPTPVSGTNCHPSYPTVCLDPNAGDYDCAGGSGDGPNHVQGPIPVLPPDPFGLDRDRDGIGCE